jgi:hypothetical protein
MIYLHGISFLHSSHTENTWIKNLGRTKSGLVFSHWTSGGIQTYITEFKSAAYAKLKLLGHCAEQITLLGFLNNHIIILAPVLLQESLTSGPCIEDYKFTCFILVWNLIPHTCVRKLADGVREHSTKEDIWVRKGKKQKDGKKNCTIKILTISIPRQILFGWSK